MGLLNLLFKDPFTFIIIAVSLLYSVIMHELAHGWVANRLGDPTAKLMGRLTLNPIRHLDLIGTLMLFIVGFGWAKPVPVNFSNIAETRKGLVLVSSAGVIANFILAFFAIFLLSIVQSGPESFRLLLSYTAQINIMLAAFNLIPIPPLDGSKILMGFVSERIQYGLSRLEPFGFFIIIGLLYLRVLDPLISFFRWIILSVIGVLLPG